MRRFTIILLMLFTCSSVAYAEPAAKFVYLAQNSKWCATNKSDMAPLDESQFELDRVDIWFDDHIFNESRPIKIREYRTDEDGEWSTLATYILSRQGKVTSAHLVVKSGLKHKEHVFHFLVVKGRYKLSPKKTRPIHTAFRQIVGVADFPFAALIKRLPNMGSAQKLCFDGASAMPTMAN
jgi:hypothetical protein